MRSCWEPWESWWEPVRWRCWRCSASPTRFRIPAAAIWADSGNETKFPAYSSPVVPAMTTSAALKMGATVTETEPPPTPETSKAVPAITPVAK